MPRNGSGTYSLPPGNPVVTGTTISSTVQNNTMSDVASALTSSIAKDGQTTPTANLPMGGFKHTGVADATASDQYASYGQLQRSENDFWLTSVSGSNTIAATAPTAFSGYTAGQTFRWIQPTTNTSAVTINVSTQGAKNILKRMSGGIVALVPNDLVGGVEYSATYDGTQCVLNEQRAYSHGDDIASASTINLDTATGDCVDVTGTTTITGITLGEGEQRTVRFTGILTLTNGANLILPLSQNIITAVGDYAVFRGYDSGIVRLVSYNKANGTPLSSGSIQGSIKNFKSTPPGANSYTTVITCDEAVLENSSNAYITQRNVNLTLNANGTVGAPLSVTSARAASTWYYRWLWYNATNGLTATLDTSATAPTAPTGYSSTDYKCRLPAASRTDSSGSTYLIQIETLGKRSQYVPTASSNTLNLPVMASGSIGTFSLTTPTWASVAVGSFVPMTATSINLTVYKNYLGNTSANPIVAPNSFYGGTASSNPPPYGSNNSTSGFQLSFSMLLESNNIYACGDASGFGLFCFGWEEA